ncbi:hypothetical protein [Dorea longicatena]|uniref:hypothetical protein n=1 Tax=Dorea longicatena TaxID=88431 RepID=UPI00156E8FB9|nr:hypothetical protein [Dorea longicatena]NSD67331.1 hypothetical protein [Dorea longicatena]
MRYIGEITNREVVLIRYYNVLFYLIFRIDLDEYKKNILINRIDSGEALLMKDIYIWCEQHQIPVDMKFIYRKDFSVTANLWNLYSFLRFCLEVRKNRKEDDFSESIHV